MSRWLHNGLPHSLPPLEDQVMLLLTRNPRGVTQMDALRALGVSGGSFTKRVSVLRQMGISISRTVHKDPITGRKFGRWALVRATPSTAAVA